MLMTPLCGPTLPSHLEKPFPRHRLDREERKQSSAFLPTTPAAFPSGFQDTP